MLTHTTARGKQLEMRDGYVCLSGKWQDGDEIVIDLPMPVRVWHADERVRENIGRVAFTRGPITYCAEEADNGSDLHLLRIADLSGENVRTEKSGLFGHECTLLKAGAKRLIPSAGGLYRKAAPPAERDVQITLIPYYAWANRGEGEMSVWLRS